MEISIDDTAAAPLKGLFGYVVFGLLLSDE
jgi:hypothetical protein